MWEYQVCILYFANILLLDASDGIGYSTDNYRGLGCAGTLSQCWASLDRASQLGTLLGVAGALG